MRKLLSRFFDEILLYSGQYALFYILMNFSDQGLLFFGDLGHTVLLAALLLQTVFLTRYGSHPAARIGGSLISPLIYTLIEVEELVGFISNMGHFFFWVSSLLTGVLNALNRPQRRRSIRAALEFSIVFMNIVIFVFIYFYFDLKVSLFEHGNGQPVGELGAVLSVANLTKGFAGFIADKAHIYLIIGGILLGVGLGIARIKILQLNDKISDLFGTYVDRTVRDRIIEHDGTLEERQNICILFSDIRDFTALSEANSARDVIATLNSYFSAWNRVVSRHHGFINKFIGDAVMVIFEGTGDRSAIEDAVECSLDILGELPALQADLQGRNLPQVEGIGIGINYGEVILGNIGSDERKDFTVIGDVVNIAARLETATKKFQTPVIISEPVYEGLSERMRDDFARIGKVELKGKRIPVGLYGLKESIS